MGKYIKGSGYTPIYVTVRYTEQNNTPESPVPVGAGLTYDWAVRFAEHNVQDYLQEGYIIVEEIKQYHNYYCMLQNASGSDIVILRTCSCALVHN